MNLSGVGEIRKPDTTMAKDDENKENIHINI